MGVATTCTVTVSGTVLGTAFGPISVDVPSTPEGIIDVTIPIPLLGDLVLTALPCPLDVMTLSLGDTFSLSIAVVES